MAKQDNKWIKAILAAAGIVGAFGVILGGGKWLISTSFVPNEAFASHKEADDAAQKNLYLLIQDLRTESREGQLVNCMVAAKGNQPQMEMCQRVIIRRGKE
jgi:hypothetical protein